ncbi:hypothetical protein BU14_0106s0024 [Porphyra umbilicalis]|uniref:Uncharacterized protein n=1 Tax=Porphyra umbilicalis TaxID=2786 RepID=A0A1X6PCF9_PORUM|nr:hypothetical protein BU14_0106s0024 [Porphyra umbilicalis]|eukprot:OSX78558.1 hypothetical protein BU14_0106s0024 [Porphyra umbilicalis]
MDKLSSLLGGDAGESPAQAMKEKVLHETIESKVASVTSEKVADSAPVQKAIGTAVDMLMGEDSKTGLAGADGAGSGIGSMASKMAGALGGADSSEVPSDATDQLEKAGAGGMASQLQGVLGGIGGGEGGPAPSGGLANKLEGMLGGDDEGAGSLGAMAAGLLKK